MQRHPLASPAGSFVVRDMLTPEEITRLRRKAKEASAYYRGHAD